jgi:hypothetical protein
VKGFDNADDFCLSRLLRLKKAGRVGGHRENRG